MTNRGLARRTLFESEHDLRRLLSIMLWALVRPCGASCAASKDFDTVLTNAIAASVLVGLARFLLVIGLRKLRSGAVGTAEVGR